MKEKKNYELLYKGIVKRIKVQLQRYPVLRDSLLGMEYYKDKKYDTTNVEEENKFFGF
jgi:hypothetical protein